MGQTIQIILGGAIVLLALYAIIDLLSKFYKRVYPPKQKQVPNVPTMPPLARTKFYPSKTIDTRYGERLFILSEQIYLSKTDPSISAKMAVQEAKELLFEIEVHCSDIDFEKEKIEENEMIRQLKKV